MALTKCFECGRDVSTTAPTCPGCGAVLGAPPPAAAPPAPAPQQQGSNAGAAIASVFIPGLGQVIQGRPAHGALFFFGSLALWPFFMGWILHLVSAFEAGGFKPEYPPAAPALPGDSAASSLAETSATSAPATDDGSVFGLPLGFWLVVIAVLAFAICSAAFAR